MKTKDEAQRRRTEALRGLSPQERLEFYRRAHEALVRRQQRLREIAASAGGSRDESGKPA